MNQTLLNGLSKLGISLEAAKINQLETYMNLIMEFNKTYNIMKAESIDELTTNHILDSLAAVPYLTEEIKRLKVEFGENLKLADIGSGGGCPGIPLSIVFDDVSFTLVERMDKRCAFLERCIAKLGLNNTKVLPLQADKVTPKSFHLEVFRAFHPFENKIMKILLNMLIPGGTLCAYKARAEKINSEMQNVHVFFDGPQKNGHQLTWERIQLQVPGLEDHERNLVVVK